jgi:SPP1 family predicted phage head-tail adaptor
MDIGILDRRVRVERKTVSQDPDYGSQVETWATYVETWASIQDITTNNQERTNSDLRQLTRPCRVKMRYFPDIDPTMRLVVLDRGERILSIVSKPAELGRKDGIEFMCQEFETGGES